MPQQETLPTPRSLPSIRAKLVVATVETVVSTPHSRSLELNGAVEKPGRSITSFSASGAPSTLPARAEFSRERADPARPLQPYPDRKVSRPFIPTNIPDVGLEEWASSVGLELGPLEPEGARHKVFCLLYHYRHLNGTDQNDSPYVQNSGCAR